MAGSWGSLEVVGRSRRVAAVAVLPLVVGAEQRHLYFHQTIDRITLAAVLGLAALVLQVAVAADGEQGAQEERPAGALSSTGAPDNTPSPNSAGS